MARTPEQTARIRARQRAYLMAYAAFASSKASWTPTRLFASGEIGAWYDPSDLTTMFQDSAGTTPVTAVGQAVGLILDKSQGLALGAELVTNGNFSSGTTGWIPNAATIDIVSGEARLTATSAGLIQVNYQISTVAGRTYYVTGTLRRGTCTQPVYLGFNGGASRATSNTSNTSIGLYIHASAASTNVQIYTTGAAIGETLFFDNISVKEIAGNHASQTTDTAKPILSARVNLLTYSEDFRNTAAAGESRPWTYTGSSITVNSAVAPNGTSTANTLTENSTAASSHRIASALATPTASSRFSCYMKRNTRDYGALGLNTGEGAIFNLANGTVTDTTGSPSAQITAVGNGWYLCSISAPATGLTCRIGMNDAATAASWAFGMPIYNGNGSGSIYIWGADLRTTNQPASLPLYQRIVDANTYDTSGFPYYLSFDGTDDFLVTGTINPGSVDKAQVFAGVRKNTDPGLSVVSEYSASTGGNAGAFILAGYNTGYIWRSRGSVDITGAIVTSPAAPSTNVLTGLGDIAGDSAILRSNSTQVASDTGNQGTGNFGSYAVYVGARGGSGSWLNGQLYSLIFRFSAANLDAATITATETWVNSKTLAY